ncbi:transcriptional regulator [Streptomyces lasalocidi]
MTEPTADALPQLEQLLLDPTRLTIVSLVSATNWCEFAFVRANAQLSDSALSKQLTTLGGAAPRRDPQGIRRQTTQNLGTGHSRGPREATHPPGRAPADRRPRPTGRRRPPRRRHRPRNRHFSFVKYGCPPEGA